MKVRCIENTQLALEANNISYNREYKVVEEDKKFYKIHVDSNELEWVLKTRFTIIEEPKTQTNIEKQSFVVYSENRKLLLAFLDTCIEADIPEDTNWNKGHINNSICTYLGFTSENMQLYSHKCERDIVYNLPQDWDKALECAKELYLQPKYTGLWKVGDVLTKEVLNSGKENLIWDDNKQPIVFSKYFNFDGNRTIKSIKQINSIWFGEISDTYNLYINLENIPTEDELILAKAVKESGLKIGDKGLFDGLPYVYTSYNSIPNLKDISGKFRDTNYYIKEFKLVKNTPLVVIHLDEDRKDENFWFKLSDIVANKHSITISGHKAEKTSIGLISQDDYHAYLKDQRYKTDMNLLKEIVNERPELKNKTIEEILNS